MSSLQKIQSLLYRPAVGLLASASPSVLASGFARANSLMSKISSGLHGLAAITITVAVVWVGYRMLWNGQSLKDCGNIIIGAILIISGAEFAQLFIV
jgi:type IV secretion system protein VirB2